MSPHGGNTYISDIVTDAQSIGTAARAGDSASVATGCGTLSSHATDAQGFAPIPDTVAQEHWSKALDSYRSATADCVVAATAHDTSLLLNSSAEIGTATQELAQVAARITEITSSL